MELNGITALKLATEISKVPDGTFDILFFPYNKSTGVAGNKLKHYKGCKTRKQLPADLFSVNSENYFLFSDADGKPKMCYKYLIRYMSFPHNGGKLRKIKWID